MATPEMVKYWFSNLQVYYAGITICRDFRRLAHGKSAIEARQIAAWHALPTDEPFCSRFPVGELKKVGNRAAVRWQKNS